MALPAASSTPGSHHAQGVVAMVTGHYRSDGEEQQLRKLAGMECGVGRV